MKPALNTERYLGKQQGNNMKKVQNGSNSSTINEDFVWEESDEHRWSFSRWCKPSCIPISLLLMLIVLVVLLPLLEQNEKLYNLREKTSRLKGDVCDQGCNIQIVESIPDGLIYPDGSPTFLSTYDAWKTLIGLATRTIEIGSFYWTLRGEDVYNHSSAWQGEDIFKQLLETGLNGTVSIKIAQSAPTSSNPSVDTDILSRRNAAQVRSVDFPRLFGGGVLHTKVWIVDRTHFYVGSANMDWRSLTQVKELGVLVTNCSCLASDVAKIFDVYWDMGTANSKIPPQWPEKYSTKYNSNNSISVKANDKFIVDTYLSSSPPPMSPSGRSNDLDAIVDVIQRAEKFIHISVMDYFPLTLYTAKPHYWPIIDDALRKAAIERKVSVRLLISYWKHSRQSEAYFLNSIQALSGCIAGVTIEVKRFMVPSDKDQQKIPFGRVNHNKYMVTDNTAYIGTSNWSGDYFINTAGIGLVMSSFNPNGTIVGDLQAVFERDWNSKYAVRAD
ncbi:5'-3' exonuclease PLD3-like [Wyeomyia smithii]|uniref:5'-3' exonuclease PLD3-like n=1 Tax=Wyeomyia smithii TaxID=174621 RepID=UPI002467C781|nr:5'-3' exonuclease PLD3-like [Wyeomyia smithii]XP_055547015.1 5'-3' exonuclease PLD3-like [Wyeomyia smithii]XP_055547016.1 5'-3' exonuclease PLD3-like [Wyeomyia smithii]